MRRTGAPFWPNHDGNVMAAIVECVARARELYPAHPGGEDEWWWRGPDSAGAHRRSA